MLEWARPLVKPGNLEDVADDDDDDDDDDQESDDDNDDGDDNDHQAGVDDLEVLQAALLHDTVEDTDTTLQVWDDDDADDDDDDDDDANDDDDDDADDNQDDFQWSTSRFAPSCKGRRGPEVGNSDIQNIMVMSW